MAYFSLNLQNPNAPSFHLPSYINSDVEPAICVILALTGHGLIKLQGWERILLAILTAGLVFDLIIEGSSDLLHAKYYFLDGALVERLLLDWILEFAYYLAQLALCGWLLRYIFSPGVKRAFSQSR